MVSIVCISDTHMALFNKQVAVPDGDVLIHAGDLTGKGSWQEVNWELQALSQLPHKIKIVTPGNHDFLFEKDAAQARSIVGFYPGLTFLEFNYKEIVVGDKKIKIFAFPWMPQFHLWAYMKPRKSADLERLVQRIPENIDILITHGPPFGILDTNEGGEHCGCEILREHVFSRIRPKVHIFGHIHECHGVAEEDGILFINASIMNERYRPVNQPIVLEF